MLRDFKARYNGLDKFYCLSDSYEKSKIAKEEDKRLAEQFRELSERDKLQAVLDLGISKLDSHFIECHEVTKEMNKYLTVSHLIRMGI